MAKSNKSKSKQASRGTKLRYPYYVLGRCLSLGKVVAGHGGGAASVPKPVIASGLEMDQGSSSFAQLASSAKAYGIVDGTGQLRLSENGREFFFPTTDGEKRSAELSFFTNPSAFAFLVEKLDGKRLPSTEIIGNMLGRDCGVPPSWTLRAAQIFISSAREIGVIDERQILRYEAATHTSGQSNGHSETAGVIEPRIDPPTDGHPLYASSSSQMTGTPNPSASSSTSVAFSTQAPSDKNTWEFSEAGGTVRLETSDPLPRVLWERLTRYVEVLEPSLEE